MSIERKGAWDGPRQWAKFITNSAGCGGWYFRLGRLHGEMARQKAMALT